MNIVSSFFILVALGQAPAVAPDFATFTNGHESLYLESGGNKTVFEAVVQFLIQQGYTQQKGLPYCTTYCKIGDIAKPTDPVIIDCFSSGESEIPTINDF